MEQETVRRGGERKGEGGGGGGAGKKKTYPAHRLFLCSSGITISTAAQMVDQPSRKGGVILPDSISLTLLSATYTQASNKRANGNRIAASPVEAI